MLRDFDLGGIAADRAAVPGEDVSLACHVGVVDAEVVPDVGVAGDQPQEHSLAAAAHQQRQARLHGLRVADGVAHREVLAFERRALRAPHAAQDGERLAELLEAGGDGGERVAVLLVLDLVPAGAEADDQPAARHLVEGGRHLGEQRGRPVAHAEDELADAYAAGDGGHGGDLGPRLEHWLGLVRDRDEVVDHPDRVEACLVCRLGDLARLAPGRAELRQAEAEADPRLAHVAS